MNAEGYEALDRNAVEFAGSPRELQDAPVLRTRRGSARTRRAIGSTPILLLVLACSSGDWVYHERYDLITDKNSSFITLEGTTEGGEPARIDVRCRDRSMIARFELASKFEWGDSIPVSYRLGSEPAVGPIS